MIGVGYQLRRRSDGAVYDVMVVMQVGRNPVRAKLRNLRTGHNHWILAENYPKRYEICPAL